MLNRKRCVSALTATMLALGLASCSNPDAPGADGDGDSQLVLADNHDLGGYNPVAGYSQLGNTPLYDGLLALSSTDPTRLPDLVPALAESVEPSDDLMTWTARLRRDVTFHDGSSFDSADVVATYQAILNPATASELITSLAMIDEVTAADEHTVVFKLKYPYIDFKSRLLIGIAPSELVDDQPVEQSGLNSSPVGTGPYRLASLSPDRAVFEANDDYFRGAPEVKTFTLLLVPDDNARASRLTAGEVDGAQLPPSLAASFEGNDDFIVDAARSADWRGVSLPADCRACQDSTVRLAMNLAVDRQQMIDVTLLGHGRIAATPFAEAYGAAYEPEAVFDHDPDAARRLLDEAGWQPGADGVRVKDGVRAEFTLAYRPTDILRRDLATAFAADMKEIGINVNLEGLEFSAIEPRVREFGVLLGGGGMPYSIDTQVFASLHTPVEGGTTWSNPGGYGNAERDADLQAARSSSDDGERATIYRKIQTDYMTDPSAVYLVFLDHTYVSRADDWDRGSLVLEPHTHGANWGPWWNIRFWTR